jgi:hypothetical protein
MAVSATVRIIGPIIEIPCPARFFPDIHPFLSEKGEFMVLSHLDMIRGRILHLEPSDLYGPFPEFGIVAGHLNKRRQGVDAHLQGKGFGRRAFKPHPINTLGEEKI